MKSLRKLSVKKLLTCLAMVAIVAGFLVTVAPQVSSAEGAVALTVKGDGVNQTVQFTMEELEALPHATYDYTGYNYYPSLQVFKNTTGVTLKTLFEQAGGLKDNATMIKIKSASSTYSYHTKRDLLDLPRYYFPAGEEGGDWSYWPPPNRTEEGKVPVETMIAYIEGGKLIFGQQTPVELTCCKGEQIGGLLPGCTIEVTTETLEQWDLPWAEPDSGTVIPGTEIKMHYENDSLWHTRIYYTLDGSEPTVKSNLYNISYPTFQPQLNKPIPVTGDMTIKARAIGLGKLDSEVRTFHYSLGSLACTVEGAGLSEPVIYPVETLKEMTQTEGTYQCSDNGQTVSLTARGVLLGALLDQLGASSKWEVKFITAGGEEYAGGTAQELKNQQCLLAYEVNGEEVADVSGEQTVRIQILRNLNSGDPAANRLKYVNTIKLVNVDDEITIENVKLLDYNGQEISAVSPGGGYCVESRFANVVQATKNAMLLIQVRSGENATAASGGQVVACAAVQTAIGLTGSKAVAEFTLPVDLSGKAYVDVFVWDNCTSQYPLGKDNHELNFNIE